MNRGFDLTRRSALSPHWIRIEEAREGEPAPFVGYMGFPMVMTVRFDEGVFFYRADLHACAGSLTKSENPTSGTIHRLAMRAQEDAPPAEAQHLRCARGRIEPL